MRVAFDDQIFHVQRHGGASRYFFELERELIASNHEVTVPPLVPRWTTNEYLLGGGVGRLPARPFRRPALMGFANALHLPRDIDVLHHTYYHPWYLRLPTRATRRAVTVLDMTPERFPQLFADNPHRAKREFVRTAQLVICISEATRADVLEFYGELDARVVVTPLGVDRVFRPGAPTPGWLPEAYVLFVGKRSGYKDFSILAKAFARAELPAGVSLLCVGGGAITPEERRAVTDFGLTDRVQVVSRKLNDEELAGIYGRTLCFVFPSRYEGFGLPTLEAMACGAPTILADASSHPEVGGDAALYFQPGDADELSTRLRQLHGDPALRRRMREAGINRAAAFTWSRTAQLTAEAYRAIA
jgi:glycosyltransferase involved in cell wall biosynthesis